MKEVFTIESESWNRAGPLDVIHIDRGPGQIPYLREKYQVAVVGFSIVCRLPCHLSGPTGGGKTTFVEALSYGDNFERLCEVLGVPPLPLRIFPIEPISFESAGEVLTRRALRVSDGASETFDEWSNLLGAMSEGAQLQGSAYPVLFLREVGRCHAQVQSGLLNCMSDRWVRLADGTSIPNQVSWLCDSNHLGVEDGTGNYVLSTFDSAFKRRWLINLSIHHLGVEHETFALMSSLQETSSWL